MVTNANKLECLKWKFAALSLSFDRSNPIVFNNTISDLFCHNHNTIYNAFFLFMFFSIHSLLRHMPMTE
jgi:hypothetical protein